MAPSTTCLPTSSFLALSRHRDEVDSGPAFAPGIVSPSLPPTVFSARWWPQGTRRARPQMAPKGSKQAHFAPVLAHFAPF
jgi:hypothetical protein